ncbi:MAG: helix-turn-helix domain-containing protein [Rhodospirillales bacterium]|nr:helix-turn-helix domain-containing protein [Acetobacter sp.]
MGNDCFVPPYRKVLTGDYRVDQGFATRRSRGTADWQLIYTMSGAGCFRLGDAELITTPGTAVLLRPGTPQHYSVARSAGTWRFLWFHFWPRADWEPWLQRWPLVAPGTHHLPSPGSAGSSATGGGSRNIGRLLAQAHRWASGTTAQGPDRAFNAMEAALLALGEVGAFAENGLRASTDRTDPRVEAAAAHLRDHLTDPPTLPELSRRLGLSPSRLAHRFRDDLGVAPGRYLEMVRLAHAQHLLGATAWSVKEIAARAGFEDAGYFSRRFRRWAGCSPQAYRTNRSTSRVPLGASSQPS